MKYCLLTALLASVLAVSYTSATSAVPPGKTVHVFASHGEAVYRHEERSKSQKQAVQAFLVDGVAQALASLSGSSRTSEVTRAAKERILKQPERYVESYRLNAEGPSKGVYRVSGLVTVKMDSLKKELDTHSHQPAPTSAPIASPRHVSATGKSGAPPVPVVQEKSAAEPNPSGGDGFSKSSVCWAVVEKWEDQWVLPGGNAGGESPFSRYLLQETEDFSWTLSFLEPGEVSVDPDGNVPVDRVAALATRAGSKIAVLGKVTSSSARDPSQKTTVSADLRLVEACSGKVIADVRKETITDSGSIQETLMGLASQAASQLDRTLQPDLARPAKAEKAAERSTPAKPPDGTWVLDIQGEGHYTAWEALLNALRKKYPDVRLSSVDVDKVKTKVSVEGIDDTFFTSAQDAAILKDLRISVERLSTELRHIELSVQSGNGAAGASLEPRP